MSCSFDLPQDLFAEILVRLSIKDVVKCTIVCKSWNSTIKNPTFISTHLSLKKTISFNHRLLLFQQCTSSTTQLKPGSSSRECVEHYSLRFDNENVDEYKKLHFPANELQSTARCICVAGSYDGFVQLDDEQVKVCVEAEVYSLNLNRWKRITNIAPSYGVSFPAIRIRTYGNSFVNGAIHLLAYDRKRDKVRNLVLAFDVSKEVFSEMALPEYLNNDYMRLVDTEILIYGQSSIAVMTNNRPKIHLWVMKEYGVASSWTKVLVGGGGRVARVLFFRTEEEVFLITEAGWIASLDITSQHLENVGDGVTLIRTWIRYPVVDSFVESLVLLDKGTPLFHVIDESRGTKPQQISSSLVIVLASVITLNFSALQQLTLQLSTLPSLRTNHHS
ncbi:hypothetical protein COLO4_28176 [Corchorus olitorius]|uniref:F-box domain-containing protein n=1 Tax=Corchorus olitorius TaxID=93759 RepID=A0A1R3HMB6_9ROSI|nr:hypothetical protein COLO4_28176 [Corchorus olitorius]